MPAGDRAARTGSRACGWPSLVVAALLVVDLLLIAASVDVQARGWSDGRHRDWLLPAEGGWSEQFAHAKQATVAALLLVVGRRTGWPLLVAWAAVFCFALGDDRLQVHERAGGWLARTLALPEGVAGLRAQDLGELAVWGLVGVVPLAAVVVLHRRSDGPARRAGRGMAVVVGCYVFFGVVVDQLHAVAADSLDLALGTVEDGGELVVLSLAVGHVVALLVSTRSQGRGNPDQGVARSAASASSSPA